MRKIYSYKDISYEVEDNEDVFFSVELISDGNLVSTAINLPNVPPEKDPVMEDAGTILLGKGRDLRDETTFVFSDVLNLVPKEDEIEIHYSINGETVVEHKNPKSEDVRPYILIFLKFPK